MVGRGAEPSDEPIENRGKVAHHDDVRHPAISGPAPVALLEQRQSSQPVEKLWTFLQKIECMRQSGRRISWRRLVDSDPGDADRSDLKPGAQRMNQRGFDEVTCWLRLWISTGDTRWK